MRAYVVYTHAIRTCVPTYILRCPISIFRKRFIPVFKNPFPDSPLLYRQQTVRWGEGVVLGAVRWTAVCREDRENVYGFCVSLHRDSVYLSFREGG